MSKETKEVTMTVEKSADVETKVDEKRVEAAKAAYDAFGKEMQDKVYLVTGGADTAEALKGFLEKDAQWAAHESLGIVRAHEDISKATPKGKKELFLSHLCIEAVAYYVSKATGVGLAEAKYFKENVFGPINEAMAKIQADKQKAEHLQLEWAAAAQGVDVEDLKKD